MKTTTNNCQYCNKEYAATRSDARYCHQNCKQNAYLDRLKNRIEKVKADEQQEQDEYNATKLRMQAEEAAKCKEWEIKIEELKKVKKAEQKYAEEESLKRINETFKEFENDMLKRKVDDANKVLKEWLQQLLEFDRQEATSVHEAKCLFEKIIRSGEYTFCNIPSDYKHLSFINNILIPKTKNWLGTLKYSYERYVNLALPISLSKKFTDILCEID